MNQRIREVPTPENYGEKEVYAFFGLAAYWAQVLEQAFIHLAIILQISGKTEITRKDIDSLFDKFGKKPMGHLLNEARKVGPIPTDLDTSLSSALDRRNYLTHRFFFEHSEDFISENGRSTMIQELQSITTQFQSADIEWTELFFQ